MSIGVYTVGGIMCGLTLNKLAEKVLSGFSLPSMVSNLNQDQFLHFGIERLGTSP